MPKTKTCTKCGARKPISKFAKNRTTKDGLSSWCRECHIIANRAWRSKQPPRPPKRPKPPPSLTAGQIELVQLIAKGLDVTELAAELGLHREAVKGRCKRIEDILGVKRLREVPYAYWLKTGRVPFGPSEFDGRVGTPLGQVVEEMFNEKGGT